MNVQDLRGKSLDELQQELVALRREQFNLRMQQANGELTRHTEQRRVRKDIARVKTVLTEQKRSASEKK
jgi:large subunit ribosomal protein L29